MLASHQWQIDLRDEDATRAFAQEIAHCVAPNDVVTLSGDLGAGKTTFARYLIRAVLNDDAMEVPSPTFTLMQHYEAAFPIVHADLYRIKTVDELYHLGWDEAGDGALMLVEWAQNGGEAVRQERLDVHFTINPDAPQQRHVIMTAYGAWVERMQQARLITDFLIAAHWHDAERHFMLGDASTRAYERLVKSDGQKAILMISPRRADGPVLRQGKSYSALAHLAEDMTAFIAIDKGLQAAGIRVPDIYAYDVKKGLALLEDLGSGSCVDHDGPMVERYQEAVSVLAHLHHQNLPDRIRVDDIDYQIPVYDMEAQLIEVELFLDWYVPYILKKELSSAARALFISQWRNILSQCMDQPLQWVLRDYHSPNLLWCEEAEGLARIGVIDFQDCVRGHPAYDVVSLLQDARVSVPDEMELKLLAHYIRLRRPDPQFNFLKFTVAYAVLGAQRATKILGIFARLDQRDGKPHYLAHLPRVEAYFRKNIGHIAFQSLREWFATYLPDYALSTQPKTEIKDGA